MDRDVGNRCERRGDRFARSRSPGTSSGRHFGHKAPRTDRTRRDRCRARRPRSAPQSEVLRSRPAIDSTSAGWCPHGWLRPPGRLPFSGAFRHLPAVAPARAAHTACWGIAREDVSAPAGGRNRRNQGSDGFSFWIRIRSMPIEIWKGIPGRGLIGLHAATWQPAVWSHALDFLEQEGDAAGSSRWSALLRSSRSAMSARTSMSPHRGLHVAIVVLWSRLGCAIAHLRQCTARCRSRRFGLSEHAGEQRGRLVLWSPSFLRRQVLQPGNLIACQRNVEPHGILLSASRMPEPPIRILLETSRNTGQKWSN